MEGVASAAYRYGLAVFTVTIAFALRKVLEPVIGGGSFGLFLGAILIASIAAGAGPGILATLLSIPAGFSFGMHAGAHPAHIVGHAALFVIDAALIVYVSNATTRARRSAERSATRAKDLLELAPDAVLVTDPYGSCIDANQAACRMLGYDRKQLLAKKIHDMIPAEDEPRLDADRRALRATKQVIKAEWRMRRADGSWVPVEVSATVLPDLFGLAFIRDISDRKAIEELRGHEIVETRRVADDRERLLAREQAARCHAETIAEQLRESEERFRLTLDEAPIGMALVTLDGHFLHVNAALSGIVGYSVDELLKLGFQDITHPEDVEFDVSLARELATTEHGRYQLEKRYVRKDGSVVMALLNVSLLRSRDGKARYFISQVLDISERKRAEDALRLSEARLSGIISISADAIILVDLDQRITLFNAGAEAIFGYTAAEALGAPLELLIPERSRASNRDHIAEFAAGSSATGPTNTIVARRKNGEEFPADASISKLVIDGAITLTIVLRDITDRKRIERDLQLLAEAGSALVSLDPEQTLEQIAWLAVPELADSCIVGLVDPRAPTHRVVATAKSGRIAVDHAALPFIAQLAEARRPLLIDHVDIEALGLDDIQTRQFRQLDLRSMMALPLAIRGQLIGVMVLASAARFGPHDLQLAEAFAWRAALAIENGRLYETAVHATWVRDKVLGIVAHDLRNPLGVIELQTEAIIELHPELEPRSLGAIERSTERMKRLIQDLLDVTRIEAGELGIERARVATGQLLDAIDVQRVLAAKASIELRIQIASPLPDLWGDEHRIFQVFENLIGNAIKFTPAGGAITLGGVARDDDVLFWVADTGPGIEAKALRHVFDRFWQADKQSREGAGLGLAIARGIVEAHGGAIWVESEPDHGATFYVTFPKAPRFDVAPTVQL